MRVINKAGEELIKSFEACSLTVYQDIRGIWTIGWGHTKDVTEDSAPITQDQAEAFFQQDLRLAETEVSNMISKIINDNQFSALVSLVFNCGTAPLVGHLGQYVNNGQFNLAADFFLQWDHSTIDGKLVVMPGLTRRRIAERELFLT